MEGHSSVREEIEPVLGQHAELKNSTHSLLNSLNAVLDDALLDKARLIVKLQVFIGLLREHILLEETMIYPMLKGC